MKATILCPSPIAAESHRNQSEDIDIEMGDTIADVKVKTTMIFTQLDP
jgi:hypothetical protein